MVLNLKQALASLKFLIEGFSFPDPELWTGGVCTVCVLYTFPPVTTGPGMGSPILQPGPPHTGVQCTGRLVRVRRQSVTLLPCCIDQVR